MEILLIRTKALIPTDKLMQLHDNYVKQLKSGGCDNSGIF